MQQFAGFNGKNSSEYKPTWFRFVEQMTVLMSKWHQGFFKTHIACGTRTQYPFWTSLVFSYSKHFNFPYSLGGGFILELPFNLLKCALFLFISHVCSAFLKYGLDIQAWEKLKNLRSLRFKNYISQHLHFAVKLKKSIFLDILISRIFRSQPWNLKVSCCENFLPRSI